MSEIKRNHEELLEAAKKNGHEPGYTFAGFVTFCQRCNALLTYRTRPKSPASGEINGDLVRTPCKC